MMRIIAGKHRGRNIESLKGKEIRPTSGRVRESIFNILIHGLEEDDPDITESHVLDVYCGSGAMGLEALSRGALSVTFVDKSRESISVVKQNVARFHEEEAAHYIHSDATQMPRARHAYPIIFIDPPYKMNLMSPTLKSLLAQGWVAPGAILIAEIDKREALKLPPGLAPFKEKAYGKTAIQLLRFVG